MEYGFRKAKLPLGMSFPLKRSVLDAALVDGGVSTVSNVYYSLAQRTSAPVPIVRAEYFGESRRDWAAAGTTSITLHAIPSGQRHVIEAALRTAVLPALIRWLVDVERAGSGPRAMNRNFTATWTDDAFSIQAS